MWQDIVLMLGDFGFAIALIPSLKGKEKPSRKTCFMTAAILFLFLPALITKDLPLAAFATALCCLCWVILFLQKRINK